MGKATLLRDIAAKIAEKGKPFYSAAEKAAQELPRTKGTGAEFMRELEKTKGVKPAEIQHRKLDEIKSMPKMTKEEFVKEVQSRPAAQVEEKIIRDPSEQDYKDLARRMMEEDATEYVNNTIGIRTPRKSEQWDDLFYEELGRLERYRSKEYLERAYQQPESFDLDILTRYNDPKYLLPGGENYREMLLKLPERGLNKKEATDKMVFESMARRGELSPEQQARLDELTQKQQSIGENYQSAHWKGEPNVLAHMRVSDRVGPNGEKVLHVEEIQSDWHQAGRKARDKEVKRIMQEKGISRKEASALVPESFGYAQSETKRIRGVVQPDEYGGYKVAWEDGTFSGGYSKEGAEAKALEGKSNATSGVPDAPFKKNWQELAMNRLLSYAAENGYDRVALTPGAEQAKRYDLSKHINEINYGKNLDGTYSLTAIDKNGRPAINNMRLSEQELENTVGKEIAQKIIEGQGAEFPAGSVSEGKRALSGLDLQVGGEGMKGFYDKMLPEYLNKLGKKYGVEVDTIPIESGDKMVPDRAGLGMIRSGEPNLVNLHSFQITPEMRKDITEQGFPLYSAIAAPVGLAGAQDAAQRVGITDNEDAMKLDLMDQELREPEQNFDKGGAAFGVFPQMKGKRSKQDREASKNVPVDLLRGAVSGVLGAPGDIESLIRLLPGLNEETVLPTSEDIEKRLPFKSDTPVSRAATGLGQLAGGFYTGPGSPLKAIAGVPKAIKHGAEEFAKAAGQPATNVITRNPKPFNVAHGSNDLFDQFNSGKGITAKHIYTTPEDFREDAKKYGSVLYKAEATPKNIIDFSDESKLDKQTLNALKKAAKDAGITDKYHTFDDFLQNVMDGQLYQAYGGQRTQNAFLDELFSKYDAVKMPDAAPGGGISQSVVFENPENLKILERNANTGEQGMAEGGKPMRQEVHMNGGGAAFGVFPQMTGKRSKQDKEAAKGMPLAAVRGFTAGTLGLVPDILNIGGILYNVATGQEVGEVPYGSDYWKDVLPLKDESAAGKAATELGGMFGGAGMGRAGKAALKQAARLINDAHLYGQGPLAPITPQAMKIFIGPNAKTWNSSAAKRAEEMEKAGEDPAKIWQQTGTFRGADGVLRQEISDQAANFLSPEDRALRIAENKLKIDKLKAQVAPTPQKDLFPKALTEAKKEAREDISLLKGENKMRERNPRTQGLNAEYIFEHPELYKAYPQLRNVTVNTEGGGKSTRGALSIIPSHGQLPGVMQMDIYDRGLAHNPTSTALHEMQHAVQTLERMGPGGSPTMAFTDPIAHDMLQKERLKMLKALPYEDFVRQGGYTDMEQAGKDYIKYTKGLEKGIDPAYDRMLQERVAHEYYQRLAGEAEARAAQDRQMMTPAERLENPPPSSYDVPQEDLIVKPPREFAEGGDVGMSEGGKPKYPTPEMREKLRQLRESFLPAANEAERQKRMQQNMEQTNRKVSFSDDPETMQAEIHAAGGGLLKKAAKLLKSGDEMLSHIVKTDPAKEALKNDKMVDYIKSRKFSEKTIDPSKLPSFDEINAIESDPYNRVLMPDEYKVRDYKARIESGSMPPAIVMDEHGNILDGQHRAIAAREAGVPIKAYVPEKKFGAGGEVAKLLKLARAPAKSKQEIEAIAQRVAPQVTGEFVRGPKGTASVAGKTQKQFAREKNLPVEFVDVKEVPERRIINPEELKGKVVTGIPGDPTVTGKSLASVGDIKLDFPAPQYGGPLYGLGHEDDIFWASNLGPARGVQRVAREASQAYDAPVMGQYVMMGPESINYALHFADANLGAIDPSKMSKKQIEEFNKILRFGDQKSGPRPGFPGIENKDEALLHFQLDPHLRRYFNQLMQMPTVTERLNLPNGQDIRYAITEAPLRDLETGVTGYSMGELAPDVPPSALGISSHPTYSHDIPGRFAGGLKYPTPYELTFPDTLKAVRENPKQAPQEFGSLKMVGPRQIYDQQMIDELKMYEEAMKKLTGKKKGGLIEVKKRKAKA